MSCVSRIISAVIGLPEWYVFQVVQFAETGKFRSIASLGGIWRGKTRQDPLFVSVTMNETWAKGIYTSDYISFLCPRTGSEAASI